VRRWRSPWLALALAALVACSDMQPRPQSQPQARAPAADVTALREAAQASYAAGRWAEAAQQYAEVLRHMPQDPDMWFRLANACARSEQPDRAVAAYREALVRDPGYAKAWFNMGIVQLRQAANSFSKMGAYVSASDPMAEQAAAAHAAILDILDAGADASPAEAPAAPQSQAAPRPPATGAGGDVPGREGGNDGTDPAPME
jgi:tetratricopeptide (TPR) repeat protein